jgi:8-oxo-dGTP pyrophosphatase MutT (NUDIX family)
LIAKRRPTFTVRRDEVTKPKGLDVLDVNALTTGAPLCAGVIVSRGNALLVTLNSDGLPPELENDTWRIGGVGGGQEPGETIVACAAREAHEELCTPVRLRSSPVTYFQDVETGECRRVRCTDLCAPLLLQRKRSPTPERPFRAGLPTGLEIYSGVYLAADVPSDIRPGDDVMGLVFLPVHCWPMLDDIPTLDILLRHGAQLVASHREVQPTQRLWAPADEGFRTVATLLARHPELL